MEFINTFEYKLIYVFRINDEAHKGVLKIGEATIHTNKKYEDLDNNCTELNQAAKERINSYTNTAGIKYELLHTEVAVKEFIMDGEKIVKAFSDHDVHNVLNKSGIEKKKVNNTTGKEWYKVDLETAKNAISAVKNNRKSLDPNQITEDRNPIIFRPEQDKAIKETIKQFRDGSSMLWNAKMRFGKTLTALQVVKEMEFNKTIIITHRPVVDNGWYEDFNKIFYDRNDYKYCSNEYGEDINELLKNNNKFVCFFSMQDLRGSKRVGGKFDKNEKIFDTNWDLVVVDEAHEGTTTALGDNVIKQIVKQNNGYDTKFLALSGTPFNILNEYDKNIYTWDYVMEQKAKKEWDELNFGDSNPYEGLPELKIYTYDLGKIINSKEYVELEDKAFNFREFFRVWKGNKEQDKKDMPSNVNVGDFYHLDDVKSFLDLITKKDENTMYPYSTDENRELFKHSLWMVPGVNEAKALSKLMKEHPIFGTNKFKIVNVAGAGDEEEESEEALRKVRNAIKDASRNDDYTITISCGKLTTGVTIPEWTAVLMLAGSFSTSAAQYLQTIFRVQSPANINGKNKEACYVFDFAPDRTLKMVADAVKVSHKAGKGNDTDRKIMGEFLNYCPVISVEGTQMKQYSTDHLLQQLKRAYADRAVRNGFDDTNLYNDELLKLDDLELKEFLNLKGIIGTTKAQEKTNEIDINSQGFTDEEYEELERIKKKPQRERTPEEIEFQKQLQEKRKQKNDAISILRGVSIRIPLLIYGADFKIDEDITIEKLIENVDEISWKEFMPPDVTKELFSKFIKYYDKDVFIAAGKRIRNTVKSADDLEPTERIKKVTELFSYFKNPDKETVLTPWRVVNMHLSDCIGGYDFFDEEHENILEEPRYVEQDEITKNIFDNENTKILEINSKTGLYPLYVTYSTYRRKCEKYTKDELTMDMKNKLWYDTVTNNIFIICKTPMAKLITKRTLLGYKEGKINAHAFDDLVNQVENKHDYFIEKIRRPNFWDKEGEKMKFNAIVGNPPYQIMDGGAQASARPIYQFFVEQAINVEPEYMSMIMPARWYAGGKGLDEFRENMLNSKNIEFLHDYPNTKDCFPNVNIAGGICYLLWNKQYNGLCNVSNNSNGKRNSNELRNLDEYNYFVRNNIAINIIRKTLSDSVKTMENMVTSRNYFGISTTFIGRKNPLKNDLRVYSSKGITYIDRKHVESKDRIELIDSFKVIITYAMSGGNKPSSNNDYMVIPNTMKVIGPGEICSETYLCVGNFKERNLATNLKKYIATKFFRFLLLQALSSIHITKDKFCFVPVQNFTDKSDILWSKSIREIDIQLYKKYNLTDDEISYIESKIKEME